MPAQGVPWSSPACPVLFINVNGREERSGGGAADGTGWRAAGRSRDSDDDGGGDERGGGGGSGGGSSYVNHAEAQVAMKALYQLLDKDRDLQSVTLLSPYRCGALGGGRRVAGAKAWRAGRLVAAQKAHRSS